MFAESMLETSWDQRTRRSWTTLTSFGLQVMVIGLLLLLPLWKTAGLPSVRTLPTPISIGPRAPETTPPQLRGGSVSSQATNFTTIRLMQPGRIPISIPMGGDDPAPAPTGGPEIGLGGPGAGVPDGILRTGRGTMPVRPPAPTPVVRAIRISSMLEGNLIRRVEPVYPPLARSARIQGRVVLAAVISKAGTIENLRTLSGHPMLVPAAVDAVSQWRYRPYILNGEPVEVETQITVNFTLGGS
jgi:periplasmic protein TonB